MLHFNFVEVIYVLGLIINWLPFILSFRLICQTHFVLHTKKKKKVLSLQHCSTNQKVFPVEETSVPFVLSHQQCTTGGRQWIKWPDHRQGIKGCQCWLLALGLCHLFWTAWFETCGMRRLSVWVKVSQKARADSSFWSDTGRITQSIRGRLLVKSNHWRITVCFSPLSFTKVRF